MEAPSEPGNEAILCPEMVSVHNPSTLLTTLSSCSYYKQLQNVNSLHVMASFTGGICMGQTAAGQLV